MPPGNVRSAIIHHYGIQCCRGCRKPLPTELVECPHCHTGLAAAHAIMGKPKSFTPPPAPPADDPPPTGWGTIPPTPAVREEPIKVNWQRSGAVGFRAKVVHHDREYRLILGRSRWNVGVVMRIRGDHHLVPLASAFHSNKDLGRVVAETFLREYLRNLPQRRVHTP